MSRILVYRFGAGLFALIGLFIVWSLAYDIVVGLRWDGSLPGDGTSRWGLLQMQNGRRDLSGILVAWRHFTERLAYPPTRIETLLRGLIAAGGTLGLAAGLAMTALFNRKPRHLGDARLGTLMDAERANLLSKAGLVLGRLNGAMLTSDDPAHVLVVGPTRSGKGVSFVIPNGYMWRGSSVWFDLKRENFEAFGAHRQALGDKVFMFSPGERNSHRYNPLDFIRRDARMPTDAAIVASFIVPEGVGSSEIWSRTGRQLLTALIGYVICSARYEGQRHLRAVTGLTSTGVDFLRVLTNIREGEGADLPTWVVQGLNQFIALEKETRNSAFFNLTAALNPWTNDLVAAATAATDFDIARLRKEAMAIFIGCSIAQLDVFRPIIKILVQQIHDVLMAAMPGADEPHQVLIMIDEFRQLGRMDALISKLTINAGYGFRMVLVLQDLAQLDEVYGKATRQTTLSACQVKLFIRMNDMDTCDYVSQMLGSTTVEVRSPIIRAGQGLFAARDKAVSYHERPLRSAIELRGMPAAQAIVLVPNAPGFVIRKVVYFKDAPYRLIHAGLQGRRLKVPSLPVWADAPLASLEEVEAGRHEFAGILELQDPAGEALGKARADDRAQRAAKAAGQPAPHPAAAAPGQDREPTVTDVAAPSKADAAKPATKRSKGKAKREPARAAPMISGAPGGEAGLLQFQARPGNATLSISALLASIDQEAELSASALSPGALSGEFGEEAAGAVTLLQAQMRRHGDRPPVS